MVWKSLNSVSKLASMIPNPKDPLAPPVSLKSQIFSREVMSTTELISAKLRYEVESKGLQEYIEELPSVGVYDYHLFSQLLDRSVFPEELCSRFENFCKRQDNLEEALPAILLYQFLFPYLRKQTGYPTDDKPGIWVERVVKVPSRLQVKTDRGIKNRWMYMWINTLHYSDKLYQLAKGLSTRVTLLYPQFRCISRSHRQWSCFLQDYRLGARHHRLISGI